MWWMRRNLLQNIRSSIAPIPVYSMKKKIENIVLCSKSLTRLNFCVNPCVCWWIYWTINYISIVTLNSHTFTHTKVKYIKYQTASNCCYLSNSRVYISRKSLRENIYKESLHSPMAFICFWRLVINFTKVLLSFIMKSVKTLIYYSKIPRSTMTNACVYGPYAFFYVYAYVHGYAYVSAIAYKRTLSI